MLFVEKIRDFFRKDHPSGKSWKRRMGEAYIIYGFRSGRGDALLNKITGIFQVIQQYGIVILIVKQYTGWLCPLWLAATIWSVKKIFQYFLGLWDFKHFGWWKFEADYSARELNPFNAELLAKITDIQNKLTLKP